MKFLRWGEKGQERPGAMDEQGLIRDLSALIPDFEPHTLSKQCITELTQTDLEKLPLVEDKVRIGACLSWVPNFYCIGLNYHKADAPKAMQGSEKIVITSKATSALAAPYDAIHLPKHSQKSDWEVELGIVMAKECWQVSLAEAMDYVFGYCIVNDICERDYMFEHGGQWIKGKSVPGYGPIGPWLVRKDAIADPQQLDIWLKRNGKYEQQANTERMINGVAQIVSHMSHYMRLLPGDLIATGTPPGIGMHQNPPQFLQPGDRIELGISGLGQQVAQVYQEEL